MQVQNKVLIKSVVTLLCAALASPSFASNAELSRLMGERNYPAALQLAETMNSQGMPYGTCILGALAYRGEGPKRTEATTRKLMSSCVGMTYGGESIYAGMLHWGYGGPADGVAAGKLMEGLLAVDKTGEYHSNYAMWLQYTFDGAPRPANRQELIKHHAELAFSRGYTEVFNRLGAVDDIGIPERWQGPAYAALRKEAFGWKRRAAAENNDRRAMVQYLEGTGLDQTLGNETMMAVKLAGAHVAAGELAYYYYTGSKLSKNLPEARYWAENGAKFNNMWGTYVLGVMTRDGQGGLAANPQRAVELLTRAHEQRAEIAAADLAGMYATGKLIPQDLGKARQWLQTGYNVSPEPYKAMYAQRLRDFDETKVRADAWARQQAQQRKLSGEETFLLGLTALGVALAAQIDWSRVGEARSSGGRGATSYSEPFDFDKHQKQVYCTSYGMTSMAAFSFGGC